MEIRLARRDDVAAIADIYNDEVRHGTATFDTEPRSIEDRTRWLATHDDRYPVTVAVDEGRVVGWGCLSRWSERRAYDRTAEHSVYVARDQRGKGIGRALLEDLVARARAVGIAILVARITTESKPSLGLHRALGFQSIGTMRRVGEKFGRILDVEMLDLHLDGG